MSLYLHCGRLSACATVERRILKAGANRDVAQFACPVERTGPFILQFRLFRKKGIRKLLYLCFQGRKVRTHFFAFYFQFQFQFFPLFVTNFFQLLQYFCSERPLATESLAPKNYVRLVDFRYTFYPIFDIPCTRLTRVFAIVIPEF